MRRYKGQERRHYPRVSANFVVSYRIKKPSADYDLSQTKNVGQGGLLLTTNRKFDKGTYLTITIRFPFFPKRIEVIGEVVDSKEVVRGLIYETRIRFLNLDMNYFQKLGEFVKKNLK